MKITLDYLRENFEYESDKAEGWEILEPNNLKGDCDDYGMTAAYIVSDHNIFKFWLNVFTLKIKFHFVNTPSGGGHLVTEYDGKFIDNWHREFCDKSVMEKTGFKFRKVFWPTTVIIKMIAGKLRD